MALAEALAEEANHPRRTEPLTTPICESAGPAVHSAPAGSDVAVISHSDQADQANATITARRCAVSAAASEEHPTLAAKTRSKKEE